MARHARPRTHRKARNSAIAVVTVGAAALTVTALRAPSSFTQSASAADGASRSAAHGWSAAGWSAPSDAARANLARQSSYALQRAHDDARHRQAQEEAQRADQARKEQARKDLARKKAAAEQARRQASAHAARTAPARVTHPVTASPAPKATAAPKPAATAAAATAAATPTPTATPTATAYANNLDGWIKQALAVMAEHGIPGTYDGIYRNIMRESSGDPNAVNNWDSNAAKGTPSKGLLQVIQPTFDAYHVPGTSTDIMDPVANIVAACNYAAAMYGSIDNVYSAY